MSAAAPARDLVLLAQIYQRSGTRAITLRSSGIDSLEKLAGKRVAAWDSIDYGTTNFGSNNLKHF